ncbi:MAG TPA: hypothetical protein VJP89_13830 [Pyrinomonadaceae bacterium]|nr:hypothetical protein [Pyrinomonadaceae bacterium]
MSLPDPVDLQRLRYQQGQQLRSRDRRDQVAIETQLRAWHNRAMHNAFGIAEGFDVEFQADTAVVTSGLAYDARGRELILQRPRTINFPRIDPSETTSWLLLARFKETSEYPPRNQFSSVCFGRKDGLWLESPEFLWKQTNQWRPELGVPIARITVNTDGIAADQDFVPFRVRAIARGRIYSGESHPGNTTWEPWTFPVVGTRGVQIGFQTRIDTSQAGFTQVPCYFASLQLAPLNPLEPPPAFLVPVTHITVEAVNGFTFRIFLPGLFMPGATDTEVLQINRQFQKFNARSRYYVSWIGIQNRPRPAFFADNGATS